MKQMVKMAGAVWFLLFISGCALHQSPPAQLISPPSKGEKQYSLQRVIEEHVPSNTPLMAPRKGDNQQTIFQKDLNDDGKEEAIVLYKESEYLSYFHLVVFSFDSTWEPIVKTQIEGDELDYLTFVSQSNTPPLLLIGATQGENQSNQLRLYYLEGNALQQIDSKQYTNLVLMDVTEDNRKDMTLITLKRLEAANVKLYEFNGTNKLKYNSKLDIDPYVNAYYNVAAGRVSKHKKGIWLDSQVGAHSGMSDLIVYEEGKLVRVFQDDPISSPYPVESRDINKDGILEVGTKVSPPGQETSMVATPWIDLYKQWDGETGLNDIQRNYYHGDFVIQFPDEWGEDVQINSEESQVSITSLEGETLFEVKWQDASAYEPTKSYQVLAKTEKYVYEIPDRLGSVRNVFQLWVEQLS